MARQAMDNDRLCGDTHQWLAAADIFSVEEHSILRTKSMEARSMFSRSLNGNAMRRS